ncbi:MAG TPA: insulinase family protein [Dehalococcoidia bacterium]|jgi:predicted Zn-dependent peptidase|nr:insulinase family protein [Dehalococcoidia bacterium]
MTSNLGLPPKPTLGSIRPFTPNGRERFSLDNGMQVSMFELGSAPLVYLRLVIQTQPSADANLSWIEKYVAEYMGEGTTDLDADLFAEAFAAIGGQLHIFADDTSTNFSATVPSEFMVEALNLVSMAALRPEFPESEAERLQTNLLRELDLSKDQPQVNAAEGFRKALYGSSHPFGRLLPRRENLLDFTPEIAASYSKAHHVSNRAHLYISGQFDRSLVKGAVEKNFASWVQGSSSSSSLSAASPSHQTVLFDRPGAEQSTIYWGLPISHPGDASWIGLEVLNALLGGSFHSRITLNIREDKGYTYSPRSMMTARAEDGIWLQVADVTTDVTAPALSEIFKEIMSAREAAPTTDELEAIKQYMIGSFVREMSESGSRMGHFMFSDRHNLSDSEDALYIDRVQGILPEDLRMLAEQFIDPNRMTLSVVGDAQKIKDELEKLEILASVEIAV